LRARYAVLLLRVATLAQITKPGTAVRLVLLDQQQEADAGKKDAAQR
jgi:hypothetical protein